MARRNEDTTDFETEADFKAYLADLAEKKERADSRSPEAVRQDRQRRRRKRAENYWTVYLRNGAAPSQWIDGLSEGVIEKARAAMVSRWPVAAKFRGVTDLGCKK